MQYKDYYEILGTTKSATQAEIKSAYRKLAKKFHPDVNKTPEASTKFKDINEAFEVLSDKDKRQRYDSLGSNWQAGSDFTPPPGYENINFDFGGGNFRQGGQSGNYSGFDDLGGFSDFFNSIFGGFAGGGASSQNYSGFEDMGMGGASRFSNASGSRKKQHKPEKLDLDITQELFVSAKDIYNQKPINVKINSMEKCKKCSGVGSVCYDCGGSGVVIESKQLSVKIPPQVKEGQKIRLKSEGQTSSRGQKGDLFLIIKFKDKEYEICGTDLTKTIEVSPAEAVVGAQKDIQTLHGSINIKIPPRTSCGAKLRLKGLGLPEKEGGYGNLNVKISLSIPKDLSDKEIELYKQLLELQSQP